VKNEQKTRETLQSLIYRVVESEAFEATIQVYGFSASNILMHALHESGIPLSRSLWSLQKSPLRLMERQIPQVSSTVRADGDSRLARSPTILSMLRTASSESCALLPRSEVRYLLIADCVSPSFSAAETWLKPYFSISSRAMCALTAGRT